MNENSQLIIDLNMTQKPSRTTRRKNEEFSFLPEDPYSEYTHGIVIISKTKNNSLRRYVVLSSPIVNVPKFKHHHTLARYAFQVHLWKTQSYIIPNNLHVDHKNNNAMDDRIDNYQLLTPEQNTTKSLLLKGALIAVLICPVCLSHFEKPARLTQYAAHHKSQKLIFYCCPRCHLTSEATMQGHEKYRELRNWISDNQIYKLVRVWTNGDTKFEAVLSEKMLDFNLQKTTGNPVNYGSARFASSSERKVMIRDYRTQGLQFAEIGEKMGMSAKTVWRLANEPRQKIHLNQEQLEETLVRIRKWRKEGYSQERIGKLLGIPRVSISQYIRRHSEEWDIPNDKPTPKGDSIVTLVCPVCHSEFDRNIQLTQLLGSRAGRIMCCCKDCRWDLRIKMNKIEKREEMRNWISTNQIIRVDKLLSNGLRFFDREISHDERIRTFDVLTFDLYTGQTPCSSV